MARIGSYPIDANIQDKDAWIGTQFENRVTRQFTALGVAEYIDTKNVGLVFVGATNALVGKKGLVPAPIAGDEGKYLKGGLGDGWTTIPVYTLDVPTGTTNVNLINTDGAGVITNSFITLTGGTYLTSVHTSGSQITINHDDTARTDPDNPTPTPAAGTTLDLVSAVASNDTGHVTAVTTSTVTWPADSTYTMDVPTGTTSINLAGSDGTNDPIAFTTTGVNNGMTVTRTDENALNLSSIWQLNTKLVEGYVPKGEANGNKFWATDANGNPFWSFQPSQDQSISSVGDSNITTGVALSQNGGTVFIRGAGTITASSDNTNNIITLTGTDQNTIYTLPVAAGAANSAEIVLTDNSAAAISTVTFNGTPTKIAISESIGNDGSITIGMPDDVTVTGELTVSGDDRSSFIGQVTIPQTPEAGTDAASKAYVDGLVEGGLTFKGSFNAATGLIVGGSTYLYQVTAGGAFDPAGARVAVAVGDYYVVATDGNFYGSDASVAGACATPGKLLDVGDSIIGLTIAAANVSVCAGWSVIQSDEGVVTFTNVNGTFVSATTVNTNAAGAVTMGTIDLSAGGTASGTTFLRGDNTWDVPDGTYVLPVATLANLGGVKLGSSATLTETYQTGGTGASTQTYPVQLNAANQAGVSVPWTNLVTSVTAIAPDEATSGIVINPTTGAVIVGLDIHSRSTVTPVGDDELMIYDENLGQNQKVLVSALADYVGDGTAVANQVTYWKEANKIAGDAGFTKATGATGAITMGGNLGVSGDITIGESASPEVRLKKTNAGTGTIRFQNDGSNTSYIQLDASEDMVYYGGSSVDQVFYAGGVLNETKSGVLSTFAGTIDVNGAGNNSIAGDLYFGANADIFKSSGTLNVTASSLKYIGTGGNVLMDNNGQVFSTQALDVATAGGRFTGLSNRGKLGAMHIEQVADNTDGGEIYFTTSPSGSTNSIKRFVINSTGDVYNNSALNSTFYGQYAGNVAIQSGGSNVAYGFFSLKTLTSGAQNVGIGNYALQGITTGNNNVGVGYNAGGAISTADANTMIGYTAGASITTGTRNTVVGYAAADAIGVNGMNYTVAIGSFALTAATSTSNSTVVIGDAAAANSSGFSSGIAIGHAAAYQNTADAVVFIGYEAGYANTGAYNTLIGYQGGRFNTSGDQTTVMGYQALYTNTSGDYNTAIGMQALYYNQTADNNTAVGKLAGFHNTTGAENTFIGSNAGKEATIGGENTLVGSNCGANGTLIGSANTGLGRYTLAALTGGSFNTALGHQSTASITTGVRNTAVGKNSLNTLTGTNDNTCIGFEALKANTESAQTAVGAYAMHVASTAVRNVAVGYKSLFSLTEGIDNTAVGNESLLDLTTGNYNVAVGYAAAQNVTAGEFNVAVGRTALNGVTTGNYNIGIGYDAYQAVSNTSYNVGVGGSVGTYQTGNYNTSMGHFSNFGISNESDGDYNTTLGYYSGWKNQGENNTFLGGLAGRYCSTGSRNTIVGSQASDNNVITGDDNVVIGFAAAQGITTSHASVYIGKSAADTVTTGAYNMAIGYNSMVSANAAAQYNTCVGNYSGRQVSGESNTFLGYATGYGGITSNENTFVGYRTGQLRTAGASNTFVGAYSGYTTGTGASNTAVGRKSGFNLGTGYQNSLFGEGAGESLTTGYNNTFIGANTGDSLLSGYQNICIGKSVDTAVNTDNYSLVIGTDSDLGRGSSTGFIGANSGSIFQDNNSASWATTSDERIKKNIVDNNIGLEIINQIQVRNFEYRTLEEITDFECPKAGLIKKEGIQLGIIAQEIELILPGIIKEESTGIKSVNTDSLTWYLINAVKELKAEIEILKNK